MPPVLSGSTVTTQWLADHLGSDDLVILDATVLVVRGVTGEPAWISGIDRYLRDGHVPGAVFANLLDLFSNPGGPLPLARPDAARFEQAAASVGIRDGSAVVVYDTAGGSWAARVWSLFRSYGFTSIAVLDGGFTAWLTEGRDVDNGPVDPGHGSVTAVPQPEDWADDADIDRIFAAGQPPPRPPRRADKAARRN